MCTRASETRHGRDGRAMCAEEAESSRGEAATWDLRDEEDFNRWDGGYLTGNSAALKKETSTSV